jgi:hypothetical protein
MDVRGNGFQCWVCHCVRKGRDGGMTNATCLRLLLLLPLCPPPVLPLPSAFTVQLHGNDVAWCVVCSVRRMEWEDRCALTSAL